MDGAGRCGAIWVAAVISLWSSSADADEPIDVLETWTGHVGFFATGEPMAVDGPDGDTTSVDQIAQPASVDVLVPDVPAGANARAAFLYWGGSIPNSECGAPAFIDDEVDFTPPGGVLTSVVADECYCSVAGSMGYDVQVCRVDVIALVGALEGTYTVDQFDALIANQTTNNASFSIVLVYEEAALPPRRVALYDGLLTMSSDTNSDETIVLGGLDIDDPPSGDLTWYVLEGDVGGSSGEGADVTGTPFGSMLPLSDAVNPVGNPMNHTINTTMPAQTAVLGVDVDAFSIDAALDPDDTALEVHHTAALDKWWLAYDIVGVNVFEPVLSDGSGKTWVLHDDADGDGAPSPGDTIRYTIQLGNTGNADGTVAVLDPIAPEAASWMLVDAGGGTDVSVGNTLEIIDVALAVGASADIVFDLVIDVVPDGTEIHNTAEFSAEPGGLTGFLIAAPVVVASAGAGSSGGGSTGAGSSTGAADSTGAAASTGVAGTTSDASSGSGGGSGLPPDTGSIPLPVTGGVESTAGSGSGTAGGILEPAGCGCRAHRCAGSVAWWGLVLLLGRRRRSAASDQSSRGRPTKSA